MWMHGFHEPHVPLLADGTHGRCIVARRGLHGTHRDCRDSGPWHSLGEQHAALGELRLPHAVGQKAKMPETLKATRQDMEDKAPQKLDGVEGHGPELVAVLIVEFISIKPLGAKGSGAPGSYAGHSRSPSRDGSATQVMLLI